LAIIMAAPLSYDRRVLTRITSRQHPLVRRLRHLARRRDDHQVLLDGDHLLTVAIDAGVPLDVVLSDGKFDVARRAASAGADLFEGSAAVLAAASPVRTPSGLVAIATWRPDAPTALLDRLTSVAVGLVGVQDPGNVGSVIRSADAFDAGGVLCFEGTADPAGWKALRGAMGSTFRVPVACGALTDVVREARARRIPIAAAVPNGGQPLGSVDLAGPLLLLLGNEGAGLPPEIVSLAGAAVSIPMRAGVDSVNIGVAAALFLWEVSRQRHLQLSR
jgi:TrmH family RNA methyltransferase